jgi:GrpB-like predicted nucleotidyltransferase (UPF0157 family)
MTGLIWSDALLVLAARTRDEVAAVLVTLGVPGDLVLTGATSVPGALTKGDIDLHLRVPPDDYPRAVATLSAAFPVGSPHSWAATLAVFDVPGPRPTGLAVTPVGSEHDERFCRTWQALRGDPDLLAAYNAMKAAGAGTPGYEEAKSAFFTSVSGADGAAGRGATP